MLNDEIIDKLTERVVRRYENINTFILKKIGESIKKIGTLTPSQAQQISQVFKYGGDYEKIVKELSKVSGLSVKDIKDIFESVAKEDLQFAKQFYDYRGVSYIPYEENIALQRQVESIAKVSIGEFLTNTSMLGYGLQDNNGNIIYQGIRETYNQLIDEAVMSVSQGKETFQESMYRQLKTLGSGGLRVIYPTTYIDKNGVEKHYTRRLDSVIRTTMQEGLRTLHNANQELIGEDFGYNGIEVTHHMNAAPDHIDTIDGKQFALIDIIQEQINDGIETEIKLSDIKGDKVTVRGKVYEDFNTVNDSLDRQVSTLNCRHKIFSIIVGVSKPEYTQEQLDEDKRKNLEGFELDGKHYTNYEGEQLQRRIETEIRKQKDTQILAKASGNDRLVGESQQKITQLTHKYHEVSKASGLLTKLERARVSNYRKVGKNNLDNSKVGNNLYDITEQWIKQKSGEKGTVENQKFFIDNKNNKYIVDDVNVILDHTKSEMNIANFFAKQKETNISMLPRVLNPKNVKSADFIEKTSGKLWEIKEPRGNTIGTTILNQFKGQKEKAHNFIIDIHNSDMSIKTAINEIENTLRNKRYDWIEEVVLLKNKKVEKVFNRTKK